MSYNPLPQPADVVVISSGSTVSLSNPFPVTLGSENITINGNVTIGATVDVSSSPDNPVHTHLTEVGTSNILNVPYLPVGISSSLNTVSVSNTAFYVKNGNTVVSDANRFPVGIGSTGFVSLKQDGSPITYSNPLPVSATLTNNFNVDLFGRLKVSNVFTLFDSIHRYSQDGDFDDVIIGSGSTVGIITTQSTATLGIGTTAGCSIIRESKKIFPYQPGKALQVLQTFVLNPAKTNLVQRVGYASSENGVMLELDGSQINIIKRTAISGVGTTVTVPQSQWNVDKLDGTGPSGVKLDLTKAQILLSEYEWLGVGCVRVGFANENGNFHIAHIFNHANMLDTVYMTTACLPVRYEIQNTGITTSSSTMKQICISVQSNGGYEKKVIEHFARRGSVVTGIGQTNYVPLVSIKLAPGREDAIVLPIQFQVLPITNNANYEIVLLKNPTLSGAGFSVTQSPNVYYDTSATSLSGGTIVDLRYTSGSNQSSGAFTNKEDYNWDLQLGRTQSKVSDIYTLAARTVGNQVGDAIGSLGFYDLT